MKYLPKSAPKQFRYNVESDTFEIVMPKGVHDAVVLTAVQELSEARLFDFLRRRPSDATEALGKIVMNKSAKNSTLFLNLSDHRDRLPKAAEGEEGVWIELRIGLECWWGWLVKIAINRIYRTPAFAEKNLATEVLLQLAGVDAVENAAGRVVRLRPAEAATAFELVVA